MKENIKLILNTPKTAISIKVITKNLVVKKAAVLRVLVDAQLKNLKNKQIKIKTGPSSLMKPILIILSFNVKYS